MAEGIELRVEESLKQDVGRGIVRLDSAAMKRLNVTTGDVVEVKGKKSTVGVVWPAHPQDEGKNIIRMDGYRRQNSGVGLGDKVFVRPAEVKEGKKIILAPPQPMKFSPGFPDLVKKRLEGRALMKGDTLFVPIFGTTTFPLIVALVQPTGAVIVSKVTKVEIREEPIKVGRIPTVSYEDIGGLKEEIRKIREMVELPMRHPELFEKLGIEAPKGVLLQGPPGCGKTLLGKAVANESEANFIYIGGPEMISKFVGESEQRLREIFKEAEENAPSIIFMDEIDAIAPKREEATGEVERRMVSQLLALLDGLKGRGEVIVIGATNRPNSLDSALRRPGRFDREIEIGVPDRNGRREILTIHTRNMPLAKDVDLDYLANITHGYSGADILLLAKESAMKALRKILPKINLEEEIIPPDILEELKVTQEDFADAMREIQPSALREVFVEVPNVHWNDIGGLDKIKMMLEEAVELPLKNPEVFEKMGIRTPKGILLYGPPGCGKTLLAKAVATESEANFISIRGPELFSKWVGESERALREIFRKARMSAPCIIFIDEIDAVAPVRGEADEGTRVAERVVNTLLLELDGLQELKHVVVLAASNRPDIIDPGLLRPGRFDELLEIPSPDKKTRLEILKVHTKNMPLDKGVDLEKINERLEGYSGADIEGICREAGMNAIRARKDKVTAENFEKAIKEVKRTVTKEHLDRIKKFEETAGTMYR